MLVELGALLAALRATLFRLERVAGRKVGLWPGILRRAPSLDETCALLVLCPCDVSGSVSIFAWTLRTLLSLFPRLSPSDALGELASWSTFSAGPRQEGRRRRHCSRSLVSRQLLCHIEDH